MPTYAAIMNFLLIVSTTSFAVQLLQSLFFQHVLQQVGTLFRGEQLLQSLNWSGLIYKGCSIFEILGYTILDTIHPRRYYTNPESQYLHDVCICASLGEYFVPQHNVLMHLSNVHLRLCLKAHLCRMGNEKSMIAGTFAITSFKNGVEFIFKG